MIITISGTWGGGKNTVAKILARRLKYNYYSMGTFHRGLVKEKNLKKLKGEKRERVDNEIDMLVDQKQKQLGKTEDNFVMDSRVGFYFIPHAVKVFLEVDEKEAAKRLFNRLNPKEKEKTSVEDIEDVVKVKKKKEFKRYMSDYDIDPRHLSNYDLIIDTTDLTPAQVADEIMQYLKKKEL